MQQNPDPQTTKEPSEAALAYGNQCAEKLISGRKGHGGGPCSYRTFRPAEIAALMAIAFDTGRVSAKAVGWPNCGCDTHGGS